MTGSLQSLSQQARLREFVFSESGATSAGKAANIGAILAGSALAGLLLAIPDTANANCGTPCPNGIGDCMGLPEGTVCTGYKCNINDACAPHCTMVSAANCSL